MFSDDEKALKELEGLSPEQRAKILEEREKTERVKHIAKQACNAIFWCGLFVWLITPRN